MISLNILQTYLDSLMVFDPVLNVGKIDSFMTNGLMVKGRTNIDNIGFAVSGSIEVFKLARQKGCQAVIVHHSFNLPKDHNFDEIFQGRYAFLVKNDISLFGYHFLLDAHPEIGNNVTILKTIGAFPDKPYLHHGDPWGYSGKYNSPVKFSDIKKLLVSFLSSRSIFYDFGPERISNVVAVSGKGAPSATDMPGLIKQKTDLFITGEAHEWNRELFREAKINFIAGGHYHTECFGIKALLEKLKKDLPQVKTVWLDLENEI